MARITQEELERQVQSVPIQTHSATATTTSGVKFKAIMEVYPEGKRVIEGPGIWTSTAKIIDNVEKLEKDKRKCKECGIEFTPKDKRQVFHEEKCRTRYAVREFRKKRRELQ